MTTYPKVDTLFDRDERFQVDTTRFRRPVFATIDRWLVTEKVDGTNMRLIFEIDENPGGDGTEPPALSTSIRGKTDSASIPPLLLGHCRGVVDGILTSVGGLMLDHGLSEYVLYGEGYGAKIQGGGRYRPDQGFVLFDVGVGGGRFLSDEKVTAAAMELGLPRVPLLNGGETMSTDEVVKLVQVGFASSATNEDLRDPDFAAEGVVARTVEPLYDNRGERVMWKLKAKDFRAGRR